MRLYRAGRSYTVTAPATHRSFDLGSLIPRGRRNESVIHDVVLAGRYVAFAIGADSRSDRVYVRDVKAGRFVARAVAPVVAEPGIEVGDSREARALALTPIGAVVWLASYTNAPNTAVRTQVVALPRGGAPRLLDASPAGGGIDGTVLAAHNGRLFWLHDGAPCSAVL